VVAFLRPRSVTSVASVSGGSLTKGYVTQAVDYTSRETQDGAEP
jgi:hypothetical protein